MAEEQALCTHGSPACFGIIVFTLMVHKTEMFLLHMCMKQMFVMESCVDA